MTFKTDSFQKRTFNRIHLIVGFVLLFILIMPSTNKLLCKDFGDYFKKVKTIKLEKNPEIGYMSNFAVGSSGNLFFIDCGAKNVFVYDNDGKLIKPLGRAGQGPGEFDCPISANIDPSGNVFICDNGWRKMIIFHPDLGFWKSFFIVGMHFMPKEFCFMSNGNIVMSGYYEDFKKPMTGNNLELYSSEGKLIKSFCKVPKIAQRKMLAYYSRAHFDLSSENKIYVIQETEYKIRVYNKEGELIKTFGKKGKYYMLPDHFPDYDKFIKLKDKDKKKLYKSWTPYKKLFIHKNRFIVLFLATNLLSGTKTDYIIDIYDLDGNLIESGIGTNKRLLSKDNQGNYYFLNWTNQDETEGIPVYEIEKYYLNK